MPSAGADGPGTDGSPGLPLAIARRAVEDAVHLDSLESSEATYLPANMP